VNLDGLVFGTGDRITGAGRLRSDADGVWLEPPHLWTTGAESGRSPLALRLFGVDPAAVAPEPDGPRMTFIGVWLRDAIQVEDLSPDRVAAPPPGPFTRPPCPRPETGWPAGDNLGDFEELLDTGAAVSVAVFHPGPDRTVLVVAATDRAAVEARLRPRLGARLCVVPSRWATRQLDEVFAVLSAHQRDWDLGMVARSVEEDGQPVVMATLLRVGPEVAAWAAGLPEGILRLRPSLSPWFSGRRGSRG
jgi:hypothetical protein